MNNSNTYNKWFGDKENPCTKDCKERKCECQKTCEKLLIYNMFHKKEYKQYVIRDVVKVDKLNSAFKHRSARNHTYLGGK